MPLHSMVVPREFAARALICFIIIHNNSEKFSANTFNINKIIVNLNYV